MNGFGLLTNIDKLRNLSSDTEQRDLVPMNDLTDEQEMDIDNITVATLDNDEYIASDKASGSAGNAPAPELDNEKEAQLGSVECDEEETDAQLDGLGLSGSISKKMAFTEAFSNEEVVDESTVEVAKNRTIDHSADSVKIDGDGEPIDETSIDKVKDMFSEMFGKEFSNKAKDKKYDLDATTAYVTTEEPRKFRVKTGW